jgi:hypothetical protein
MIAYTFETLKVTVTKQPSGRTYAVEVSNGTYRSRTKRVRATDDAIAIAKANDFALQEGLRNHWIVEGPTKKL